jgi:thiamine biosynthesis lipoprotein
MELNLGAVGKGHALDRAATRLAEAGLENFLLHGGRSSVLARGRRNADEQGWRVGIVHPLRADVRLAEVRLADRGLGTSGSGTQYFRHRGKRYGHILDPRTGRPAEGVLSATVLAPTAAEADALSTAVYVLGVERGLAFCATRPELAAAIVAPGARGDVEVHTVGFAPGEFVAA